MTRALFAPCSGADILAAAPPSGDGGGSLLGGLIPMVLIVGIFYFVLILPMRRRQKKLNEMINGLKRGDKIITTGGIFGTVMGISDRLIQLKVADQVTIEVAKNAVAALQSPEGGEAAT